MDINIENATINFKGKGLNNGLGVGNVELSLSGTLSIDSAEDGGGYRFNGILRANDNVYDFDPAENFNERWRSAPAEIATIIGSKLPGEPGQRDIKSEGVIERWK